MDIQEILKAASKLRIAIIGDYIVDKYVNGEVSRLSPEAPVMILKVTGVRANPGGAGNVAENLRGLGIETLPFYQKDIPVKTRVMSGNHHLLRMDEENEPQWQTWDDINVQFSYGIENRKYDCVIISDYGKGMVSKDIAKRVINLCAIHNIPVVVDTKSQHAIFTSASVIKSNLGEWHSFLAQRGDFHNAAHFLLAMDVENLVTTDGSRGIYYHDQDFNVKGIPGIKTEICDPCGAGDTVTAILGMMVAMGHGIHEACDLANIAASEVCRHPGVYPITKDDLVRRFNEVKK
jgi:rfaE bifunctional protein kinase chain/domain